MSNDCELLLDSFSSSLSLPRFVRDDALSLLADPRLKSLRSCRTRVALAVLLSARSSGVPLSANEVAASLGLSGRSLLRALWKWKSLGGRLAPALSDLDWIPQLNQRLRLPPVCERRAVEISSALGQRSLYGPKKRALISCYLSALELGVRPALDSLPRSDRLWLLRVAGFGRRPSARKAVVLRGLVLVVSPQ